jgi:hypothetical protein
MKTLLIIFIIWFIISYYNLNKIRKLEGERGINPFKGSFLDYMGFILGAFVILVLTIVILVKYFS